MLERHMFHGNNYILVSSKGSFFGYSLLTKVNAANTSIFQIFSTFSRDMNTDGAPLINIFCNMEKML